MPGQVTTTSAYLQQLYKNPKLDLRATQSAPHRTVVAALGLTRSTTSMPSAPSAPTAQPNAAAPARTAGNTSGLEDVYMDQTCSTSGFDFMSYAVFKDSRITNDLDAAFGGVPVGRKMRQGRWRRSGSQGFQVTWDDGKQTTLSGATFYRTFAAGSVLTFSADTVVFQPSGVFSSNASSGGSAPGVATTSGRTGGGRYSLKGHTFISSLPKAKRTSTRLALATAFTVCANRRHEQHSSH